MSNTRELKRAVNILRRQAEMRPESEAAQQNLETYERLYESERDHETRRAEAYSSDVTEKEIQEEISRVKLKDRERVEVARAGLVDAAEEYALAAQAAADSEEVREIWRTSKKSAGLLSEKDQRRYDAHPLVIARKEAYRSFTDSQNSLTRAALDRDWQTDLTTAGGTAHGTMGGVSDEEIRQAAEQRIRIRRASAVKK